MAYCPECEADLDLDETQVDEGAVITCPDCGTDYEIVTAHPLELNRVDTDEDDEEDEEEDDEEYDDEDEEDEEDYDEEEDEEYDDEDEGEDDYA